MALGAVYIRPQPLLLPASDAVTPVDVITAFGESLLKDPEAAVPAFIIMGEEAANALRDFFARMEEKLRLADGKLRNVFQPFTDPVMTFVHGLGADPLSTVPTVLESLAKLLDQFTSDHVISVLRNLFDVFQKDLGVSQTTLKNLMDDIFSRMIQRLQSRVTSGDTSDEAVALYDFGSGLDDLRLLLEDDAQLPNIDLQVVLGLIEKFWQDLGLDKLTSLIRQILDRGNQVLDPLSKIVKAVAEVNVSVAVRPTNRFMASNGGSGNGSSGTSSTGSSGQVPTTAPQDKPKDPIAWYASWVAGTEVREPADTAQPENLFQNSYLRGFTYRRISRETMESIAFHTAWIEPLMEAILFHSTSIEKGDFVNNLIAILTDGVEIGLVAGAKRPLPWWWKYFIWPFMSFWGRAFETIPRFFGDGFAPVMALVDWGEDMLYRRWTWLMRESLLSLLTLINYDKDQYQAILSQGQNQTEVQQNRNTMSFDGVCLAARELGALLTPLIMSFTARGYYSLMDSLGKQVAIALLAGNLVPLAFGLMGYVFALVGTRETPSESGGVGRLFAAVLRERMVAKYDFSDVGPGFASVFQGMGIAALSAIDHLSYLHLFTNSKTDGGTLAMDTNGNDAPQEFLGYPDPATSPYLLPFADNQMCVQGNLGFISHNPTGGTGQIYAFDFALYKAEEVLCSRDGIIISIDDTIPNGDKAYWNYVEVMHLIAVRPPGTLPPGVPAALTVAPGGAFGDKSIVPAVFADGTPIPPGTLIPQYPVAVPLHPSAVILGSPWVPPPYYQGFKGFPVGTTFGFLIPGQDRGIGTAPGNVIPNSGGAPASLKATFAIYGHGLQKFMTQTVPASGGNKPLYRSGSTSPDVTPLRAMKGWDSTVEYEPGDVVLFSGQTYIALRAGTDNPPNIDLGNPIAFWAILVDLRNRVLGQFVQQGQVIMLADNTGASMFNHVHVHVDGEAVPNGQLSSGGGAAWSIPFVYKDVSHNISNGIWKAITGGTGTPRIFTTYSSGNTRKDPQ